MSGETKTGRFRAQDRVVGRRDDADPVIRLEIYGIIVLAFSVALLLALVSFDGADLDRGSSGSTANIVGPVGAHMAHLFLAALGAGAIVLDLMLGYFGVTYLIGRKTHITKLDLLGWVGVLVSGAVLCHMLFAPGKFLDHMPGGETGAWVGEISASLLSTAGTVIVWMTLLVISIIALTRRSIFELAHLIGSGFRRAGRVVKRGVTHGDEEADGDSPGWRFWRRAAPAADAPDGLELTEPSDGPKRREPKAKKARKAAPAPASTTDAPVDQLELVIHEPKPAPPEAEVSAPEPVEPRPKPAKHQPETTQAPKPDEAAPTSAVPATAEVLEEGEADDGDFKIVESAAMKRSRDVVPDGEIDVATRKDAGDAQVAEDKPYEFPSLQLLDYRAPESTTYDREHLRRNAQILEAKLADYRVKGKVVEIHPGPVITMYEFLPAPGVKISTIANLSDDLAMALSALRIRIVAPIPGKNVVGIEVPNTAREMVWLKEILSDNCYAKAKSKLTLALGKDIVGNPTVMNLQKAPHLLVAGATGAGKSVGINSFICSLLYQAKPEDVRLILVDPKMLELSIYEGIPHLLLPVVTDPKQAAIALRWAVKEMERRYKLMADLGVRNLANYNGKVLSLADNPNQRLPERLRMAKAKREAKGELDPEGVVLDADGQPIAKLPLIVVIIDELADLMMVASKEVEHCIARLAQMARASGIHLILATQRPSVDVITGLIKANFPTRISFQVASKIDSRTILDRSGAENLLGMGDMLFLPPGTSTLQRVHGCYVSEEEIHNIVNHLKSQGQPDYDLGILAHEDEDSGRGSKDGEEYDELYDRSVQIVAETRNASISFLQRKLKIGYNRSARIVEKMEQEGIIGPSDGTSRPREVFIDPI